MASDKDSLTKAYMERPDVFADAFNFLLYDGEQVIKPEELREMDTTAVALPFGSDGKQASVLVSRYNGKLLRVIPNDELSRSAGLSREELAAKLK